MKTNLETKRLLQTSYYKLGLSKQARLSASRVSNPLLVEASSSVNFYSPLKPTRNYETRSTHKQCDCSLESKIKRRMLKINNEKIKQSDKNFMSMQGFFPECKIYTLNKFDKLKHCCKRLKQDRIMILKNKESKKSSNMVSTTGRQSSIINLPDEIEVKKGKNQNHMVKRINIISYKSAQKQVKRTKSLQIINQSNHSFRGWDSPMIDSEQYGNMTVSKVYNV